MSGEMVAEGEKETEKPGRNIFLLGKVRREG